MTETDFSRGYSTGMEAGRLSAIETLKSQIRKKKPTHGTCCTCQECGGDIDDCDCKANRLIARLIRLLGGTTIDDV